MCGKDADEEIFDRHSRLERERENKRVKPRKGIKEGVKGVRMFRD